MIDEINRNITDINELAHESDSRSADLSSLSETMAGYAQNLTDQVGRFRV